MRKLILFLAVLIIINSETAWGPGISGRSVNAEAHYNSIETVILTTEEPAAGFLGIVREQYPSLQVTAVYDTLFHGFAVKGKKGEIQELVKRIKPKESVPAAGYRVENVDSKNFIGAGEVHRLFDTRGRRLTGKGVKVGIIDTGIDYSHQDLHINYRGGFDLIDGDNDPMETKSPKKYATNHGTHVAGIIAANGKLEGIAPDAELFAYRALGPGGMGSSDQVIAAIEKAVEDKVDILNLSLGNSVNSPDWPTSLALNKAVEHGVVAITSSGNSGPARWSVGSPGTASKAISVGASSPPLKLPVLNASLTDKEIDIIPLMGSEEWKAGSDLEVFDGGQGYKKEMKGADGKLVLIKRGTIPFFEKVKNAEEAGAAAVLIFNNEEGNFNGSLEGESGIPAASVSNEDGLWLLDQMSSGRVRLETDYKKIQDTIASFSSRGPVTSSWEIKPDVVAPGIDIESTVPGGYEALQGTSMSAPHVAGAAALIKQAHPDWNPVQIKAALMNTAKKLIDENGKPLPPEIQGAGRVQVDKAATAKTLIYPSSLTFGLFRQKNKRLEKEMKLTIENQSDRTQTYSFDIPKRQEGLLWEMPFTFSLKPKQKKTVTLEMEIEAPELKKGIHQGFLAIEGGGETISVPYLFTVEDPDYPRIMGFQFGYDPEPDSYVYEMYLPEGADEVGIALFDPNTFRFIRYLDHKMNIKRGMARVKVSREKAGAEGLYKALIFARKAGKEDVIEMNLEINDTVRMVK